MNSILKTSLRLTALSLSCASVAAFANVNPSTIYGTDSRKDLFEITNANTLKLADSTVALVKKTDVSFVGATATLKTTPYGDSQGLCHAERFYDQSTAAFCSGSLVGPDLILTAGHCVADASDCSDTKFVFGFGIRVQGDHPETVKTDEVYQCAEIIKREQDGNGADFAIVRIDRKVTRHSILSLKRQATVVGGKLLVIGHPIGLPTKVADGTVRTATSPGFFVTNLDTFAGNSGSAVFDATSGEVEGILVRGDSDFTYNSDQGCMVSNVNPENGGRGEDVTKISAAAAAIDAYLTAAPVPAPSSSPSPAPSHHATAK